VKLIILCPQWGLEHLPIEDFFLKVKEAGYDGIDTWLPEEASKFAVQKSDGKASAKDLGSEPIVQKWWAYMADLMDTNPDNSPVVVTLPELFHMD